MAKSNPLFVDSTKGHGDFIGTQFEVNHVLLYDGELMVVNVVNHQGTPVRTPMKYSDDNICEARVLLSHQKPIKYSFAIERDERVLFQSATLQTRAQYAIIEEWQPVEMASISAPARSAGTPAPFVQDDERELRLSADFALAIKEQIEKWNL